MIDITPPARIAESLRKDARGYYVPWFVHWPDGGEPDFRIIGDGKIADAYRFQKCWVCGRPRGKMCAFVIGPMCAVNRTTSEPPSHRECAVYSARVCPFLTRPKMRRNEKGVEHMIDNEAEGSAGGIAIDRNPGVALVWITRVWHPERVFNGTIFKIGDPEETLWFCQGREATRAEVMASIDSGLPLLMPYAEAEGPDAVAALKGMYQAALAYVPQ